MSKVFVAPHPANAARARGRSVVSAIPSDTSAALRISLPGSIASKTTVPTTQGTGTPQQEGISRRQTREQIPEDPEVNRALYRNDVLARIFGSYYLRIIKARDSPRDVFLKRWLFGMGIVMPAIGFLMLVVYMNALREGQMWTGMAASSLASWGLAAHGYAHFTGAKEHSKVVSASMVFLALFVVVPLEMNALYFGSMRHWAWFIVILDSCLVFELETRVRDFLVWLVVLWLFLTSVENSFQVGLRWEPAYNGSDFIPITCDCESPPCAVGAASALVQFLSTVLIFLIDFSVTRGFAVAVSSEEAKMAAAISTAEDIATCLSAFDLDSADRLLGDDSKALPEKLHAAFSSVLKNLRNYKPYLPSSCLPVTAEEDGGAVCDTDSSDDETLSRSSFHRDPSTPNLCGVVPFSRTQSGSVQHLAGRLNESGHHMSNGSIEEFSLPSASGVHCRSACSSECFTPIVARRKSLAPPPRFRLQQLRASLVECNMHSTLTWYATSDASSLSEMFDKTVGAAAMCFGARGRGIVDLFVGDRIFASFNTSRPCARHSTHAVAAAKAYYRAVRGGTQHGVNVAVASGRVIGGDAGSADMRRYNVVGALPVVLGALERAGRAMDVGIVCNTACYNDTWHDAEIRRLPQNVVVEKREVRRGAEDEGSEARSETRSAGVFPGGRPEGIFQVLCSLGVGREQSGGANLATADAEWMYALESGANAAWSTYNAAIGAYLKGTPLPDVMAGMEGKPHAALLERVLASADERDFRVYA